MQPNYQCCPRCACLGSIEWLDDIPFVSDHKRFTHYYLFPWIDSLAELHKFKGMLRRSLRMKPHSNIVSLSDGYTSDEFSLLLLLFENMLRSIKQIERFEQIFCDIWMCLTIKGTDATYQTKYTYLQEVKIPNIKSLEDIFKGLRAPYSNFIEKSFAIPLKEKGVSKDVLHDVSCESRQLMSKGIILNDFGVFKNAFLVRQNCCLHAPKKEIDRLIYLWRCKNAQI